MPLTQCCGGAVTDLHAVRTAVRPANLFFGRRPCKQSISPQKTRSQRQHGRHPAPVKALQAEREKPATQKRGRPKKDTRLQLPGPVQHQQTVRKSVTLGGLGLHTGQYAYIRLRPAYANEGRYFVRVVPGTNCHLFEVDDDVEHDIEGPLQHEAPLTEDESALQVELYYRFLKAQSQGFDGAFDEFVRDEVAQPVIDSIPTEDEEEEEIVERGEDDDIMDAALDSVFEQPHADLFTTLGDKEEDRIHSVEHLLSALEGCGIDNARIEIEGGTEVPIIDGSALGWCIALQKAGICLAKSTPEQAKNHIREHKHNRQVLAPTQPITVRREDAFITLYPEDTQRLTYGIDYSQESSIIGKQWFTWAPAEDLHYRWCIAPARTFATSVQDVFRMRQRGLVKGGTEGCAIIGHGDRWREPDKVRFFDDEPVRHKMLDLIGDLALLAEKGHAGVPLGHIVAYKADHALHVEFAQAVRSSSSSMRKSSA